MNNRRKLVIALGLCALDPSLSAFAQKQDKVRRIGFLAVRPRSTPSTPTFFTTRLSGVCANSAM